jgi:hypothetical protein
MAIFTYLFDMRIFDFFKRKEGAGRPDPAATALGNELEGLGYFRYAESSELERMKQEMGWGLRKGIVTGVQNDPRLFFLDGEELFEMGGMAGMLKEMASLFGKMNVQMAVSDHREDLDEGGKGWSLEMTLNDKRYILFREFAGAGWGEAAQRFADMVNDQLRLQKSEERFYLINGGNDGWGIFLTNAQHALITPHVKDARERPMSTVKWCDALLVEYCNVVEDSHAKRIADRLEELDYFCYANPEHLPQLKSEMGRWLAEEGYLQIVDSGAPRYEFLDPRQYYLDGETLFEQGGVLDALNEMERFFQKLPVRMEVADHLETGGPDGTSQRMSINGKPYILMDQFPDYGWGEMAQRFADMVNDQLALQGSDERLYLINGANDGRGVFLNDAQYEYLTSLMPNPAWRPLRTREWCEVMQVKYRSVT